MSQNNSNNMSIEDILREAQEVLSSIGAAKDEPAEEDVKTYVPQRKSLPGTGLLTGLRKAAERVRMV